MSRRITSQLRRLLRAIGLLPQDARPLNEDAIYRQLGMFVVTFQVLETQLVQLASYALEPEHAGFRARLPSDRKGRRRLVADLWFKDLVDETAKAVGDFLDRHRGAEPEFREDLNSLLARCKEFAAYRNKLVHSAYLFLEAGGERLAIMRSNMTAGAGEDEVDLDQEMLTEDSFEKAMNEIYEVAFEIGQRRLQLIHWYP